MQIVIESGGIERELDLEVEHPQACVSDMLAALRAGDANGTGVVVEGRFFGPETGLDEIGLHEGALVRIATGPPGPPATRQGPALVFTGGPVAGSAHPLGGDAVVLGRSPDCDISVADPTVSERHARLDAQPDGSVVVSDLDSHNGTWIDGRPVVGPTPVPPGALVRFGAAQARVRTGFPDDRPIAIDPLHRAVGGLVPFNRPPRPALPEELPLLEAPEPPRAAAGNRAFSIVAILAPLMMGGVLILVYRNPRFALFMLLSPVLVIGNYFSSRRRATKERKTRSREFRAALVAFDQALRAAAVAEVADREERLPDIAETLRRATAPSTSLWQRRPDHGDFLRLRAGTGHVPWAPPIDVPRSGLDEEVDQLVGSHAVLADAAVEVDLAHGGVIGLVGDRDGGLALARSLVCQAAVHHGPADLAVTVLASADHADDWDWAKWLPHARHADGATRLLAGDRRVSDALLAEVMAAAAEDKASGNRLLSGSATTAPGRTRLLVVDDVSLLEGRRAPARLVLRGAAGPVAGIVLAPTEDQLPAMCTVVVHVRSSLGEADLRRPQDRVRVDGFVIGGVDDTTARAAARALARFEDSELEIAGSGLPSLVRLLPLLGMDEIDAAAVTRAWAEGLPDPPPNTPIGRGESGVVHLDLVRDGPHALVGGTTGSGKSELLRSLVAGMAARVDPDHLVFVLVDYKGGSAFDQCSRLPHVVGLVTDLDEHLGERALKSLEAELTHRERVLREAGAQDLAAYLRAGAGSGPLPRLVVVIDEFATLASELPDFLGALVGIAQRGRSLGVHLILATQRPSGAVNATIKANTNLRIALRVQDAGDSSDIIDRKDAASIGRASPGRAYLRRGPNDVELVQTALSTASEPRQRATAVRLAPFRFGPRPSPSPLASEAGTGRSDLARLVDAVTAAFERRGMPPPRRPWLEMLADRIELADVVDGEVAPGTVPFAVGDDPEHQRQVAVGWSPAEGHLALFGMVGSGTTTALLAVARSLLHLDEGWRWHLYAVDFGAGHLAPLAAHPQVGAVIPAADREAQLRLIRHLRRELGRRRALSAAERAEEPRIVVLVDGIGAFLAEHEGIESTETAEAFRRVFSDGPEVGILFVVAGERPGALPVRMGALVSQKVLFRLAEPSDYSAIGIRPNRLPTFVPGRAIHAATKLVVQVGHPGDLSGIAPDDDGALSAPAVPIRTLPLTVAFDDLAGGAKLESSPIELTLGIADDDLGPAVLALHANDHVLVAGPPRSGTTSTLALIASLVRQADPATVLVGVCDDGSPLYPLEALDAAGTLSQLSQVVRVAPGDGRRWFVLVDDAPRVDDLEGLVSALLQSRRPGLHVIAGGRSDDLRAGYGHWTRALRQARTGILLQPNLAADGDLLGVRLPRRLAVPLVPGRGFVVSGGEAHLAQIALPPGEPGPVANQTRCD